MVSQTSCPAQKLLSCIDARPHLLYASLRQLPAKHMYKGRTFDSLSCAVDEDNYRWEAIHYFYLSWTDYTAWSLVSNQSIALLTDPSSECKFSCSNVAQNVL